MNVALTQESLKDFTTLGARFKVIIGNIGNEVYLYFPKAFIRNSTNLYQIGDIVLCNCPKVNLGEKFGHPIFFAKIQGFKEEKTGRKYTVSPIAKSTYEWEPNMTILVTNDDILGRLVLYRRKKIALS